MTKWWLFACLVVGAVNFLNELFGFNDSFVKIGRSACAVSGICVGIGYYTFMSIFSFVQNPPLIIQLYEKTYIASISFGFYLLLDTTVHFGFTVGIAYLWRKDISFFGSVLACIYHRLWSLIHSGWRTPYFYGDTVYEFREPMPSWSWAIVYGLETLVWTSCASYCWLYGSIS